MIDTRRIVLLAAALAVTGGLSLAAGPDPEPAESGPTGRQQPVQSVDADQAARYAVLRRPVTAQDRLREQAVGFVRAMMTGENGAAPSLARRAQVTATNAAVFVIPGRGFICTYTTVAGTDEGSAGCNSTQEALRGRLVGITWPVPGVTRIVGLATDDVTEVRLRDRDGGVERVKPVANTYVFETTGEPGQLEWGGEAFPIPAGLGE